MVNKGMFFHGQGVKFNNNKQRISWYKDNYEFLNVMEN